eukprot:6213264-Pleurochrysis_carterae.AAC.1
MRVEQAAQAFRVNRAFEHCATAGLTTADERRKRNVNVDGGGGRAKGAAATAQLLNATGAQGTTFTTRR